MCLIVCIWCVCEYGVWYICVCTWEVLWNVCLCVQCVFVLCVQYAYVCVGCARRKRDTEAQGQGVLECLGHVRKPGLVLELLAFLGKGRP